jgi:hypothetical protein
MNATANKFCKIAAAALIAVASAPALAVDWNTVANTETQTVLVDRDSVHSYDGDVRAWVVHSFNHTESLGDMYPHRSRVMLYSVHCGKREIGYLQWSMQSGEFGGGQTVWADRVSHVAYYPTDADTADNALVDSVCAVYAQRIGNKTAAAR